MFQQVSDINFNTDMERNKSLEISHTILTDFQILVI